MKCRIKQEDNVFYPQYKFLFWWKYFERYVGYNWYTIVSFYSLNEAKEYIDNELKTKLKPIIKVHKYPNNYNPDDLCNVTAAKTQSQCGTTCCTPDEE